MTDRLQRWRSYISEQTSPEAITDLLDEAKDMLDEDEMDDLEQWAEFRIEDILMS